MLRNYIKTAWRTLTKNKFYSSINIIGLTAGLAIGILILLWVQDEKSYDAWHKNVNDIYKLENLVGTGASQQIWTNTVAPIGKLAKAELPEVRNFVRLTYNNEYSLYKYGDKIFSDERAVFTDPSLFSMFDYPIIKGDPSKPFIDDNSVVMTASSAKRYFGDADPIGKVITADDKVQLTVTGIIPDFPHNTYIKFDLLLPFNKLATLMYAGRTDGQNIDNDFGQFSYQTFFNLRPGTDLKALGKKLEKIHLRIKPDDTDAAYLLQPLKEVHLYKSDGSDNGMSTVRMFMIIAIVILIIACINYVNLSTARSLHRSKEVSLRKIVGAGKSQLFFQFIIETALLFVIASGLAVAVIYMLLPWYNELSGKTLELNFSGFAIWKVFLLAIGGTLIASSIYPALLLSSFEPIKALKGKISARISDTLFRKVLVVIQFSFSIILIAGTIIIGNQMRYIRSKELGYNKEHVLSFYMRGMSEHYDAVKSELEKQPGVVAVTRASSNIVRIGGQTGDNEWDGKQPGETMMLRPLSIDKDMIPFFEMKLVEGGNFTGSKADSMHFILNETAVKVARIKDPVGKKFRLWQTEGTIAGVVKDFHFASMKQKIEPAIFYYKPTEARRIYIKTNAAEAAGVISAAETLWKKYNPDFSFSYAFLDETFNSLYASEKQAGILFNIFAGMAILISCLGLFGLATYTAQTRFREIGVRKVLGASVPSVIRMLTANFLLLVVIAMIISIPIAWYMMDKWLQDFAYKTEISWTVFLIAGALALLIAMATISYQSIRAALANPVKSLRTE